MGQVVSAVPFYQLSATFLPSRPTDKSSMSLGASNLTVALDPSSVWTTMGELGYWLLNTFEEPLGRCGFTEVDSPRRWHTYVVRPDDHRVVPAQGSFLETFHGYSKRNKNTRWLDMLLVRNDHSGNQQVASFRVHSPVGSAAC